MKMMVALLWIMIIRYIDNTWDISRSNSKTSIKNLRILIPFRPRGTKEIQPLLLQTICHIGQQPRMEVSFKVMVRLMTQHSILTQCKPMKNQDSIIDNSRLKKIQLWEEENSSVQYPQLPIKKTITVPSSLKSLKQLPITREVIQKIEDQTQLAGGTS